MGKIVKRPSQTVTLTHDGGAQNLDFYIPPADDRESRPHFNLSTALVVKTTQVGADPTTSLALSVAPIISPEGETVVIPTALAGSAYAAALSLETALDWNTAASYVYDLRYILDGLPPFGYRLTATYTGGAGTSMTLEAYLVCE